LKLIKDNFHPGDKIVETQVKSADGLTAQAFLTPAGKKLLILNQRNRSAQIDLPQDAGQGKTSTVDEDTGDGPPRNSRLAGSSITLAPFAVTVVSWP
jgi:hypothetical protein